MVEYQAISNDPATQVEHRDIPNYPGYRVGSDGSVWYCWKRGWQNQRYISSEWRLMKLATTRNGYLRVDLVPPEGQSYKTFRVHRLVLEAFVGPCPEGMECRHLNAIRTDCRLSNLVWGTRAENQQDVRDMGNYPNGEQHSKAKLTEPDVVEIRKRRANGASLIELSTEFGVGVSCISAITCRRSWKHIT